LGLSKKGIRLPGGTGELDFDFIERQDRRDAPRQAPSFLSKRPQKGSKKGLSPAEGMFPSPTPGEFFIVTVYRSGGGSVVLVSLAECGREITAEFISCELREWCC